MREPRRPVRIANCSGFYGDRLSAAQEMVEGGPIDVLTGDWLAELTMLILFRDRMKDAEAGYARTFLPQMEQVLGTCMDKGIKIVANAGGLNPQGLAKALTELAAASNLHPRIAVVQGDDVLPRLGAWNEQGLLRHLETDATLSPMDGMPMAANAYLGCWGITEALNRGADIVLTGRTTDAAAVMGPAAWWHGWAQDDFDALAGALVAGHVIECGTQATGGNYAFFEEVGNLLQPGFPLAEIAHDGDTIITKHPHTGGLVSAGTVTAQLLYEIGGPDYHSPDVIARFDTVRVDEVGPDRVRVHGTLGLPPTDQLKLGVLLASGYRNHVSYLVGGLQVEAKVRALDEAFWQAVGGKDRFQLARTDVLRGDHPDATPWMRLSRVVMSARDPDATKLGKAFGAAGIELALASIPGLTMDELPGRPRPCGVFWPTLVPRSDVPVTLTIDDQSIDIPHPPCTAPERVIPVPQPFPGTVPMGRSRSVPLGRLVGARSGDKAGNANIGMWVKQPGHYHWLANLVTTDRLRTWLGGFEGPIRIHALPNLLALNVELVGWLDQGVAANLAPDPQAKCLAECIRSVQVDVDEALLTEG